MFVCEAPLTPDDQEARGYKVVIVMPSSMSVERRILIRAFGAELVLTDPKGGVTAAVEEAERIRDSRPGSIIASQFTNPANPAVHRRTTAEEILRDTDENIDISLIAGSILVYRLRKAGC